MNVSYRWLKAIAPTIEGTPEELSERLGMLGAPVDDLTELGADLGDVVIARVEEVRPHPNADRLRLCTVDAGGEQLQVVCGAPNVEAGGYYPFVGVGATLPGGMQIRKAKLRGETSEGMLCSPRELGLGRDHAGLMALAGEWRPGTSFIEALELDDTRLVLDITPNRGDLLSHLGVARELAPGGVADLRLPPFSADGEPALEIRSGTGSAEGAGVRVSVESADDCPRYMAAVIDGVTVEASPEWLATRLRAVGLRPINNVVDATNYVLHELGQPLHAFDLDRLAGPEIRVRRAREGERIRTLDGVDRALDPAMLVIADAEVPVALAGVMGGEDSEVGEGTTRILLECALFDPLLVRKTARGLGLSSDASHRFERGVDPEGQPRALGRVADLIVAVAGGSVDPTALDVHVAPHRRQVIEVRTARVRQVLGLDLTIEEIGGLLEPIGFAGQGTDGVLSVEVPPYRPDVTREIDVVEEVARRRGYDSFGEELGPFRPGQVPTDELLLLQDRVHRLFHRWGFREARTAAFAPARENRVPLLNPLSSEESHLRDQLVVGLLRRVEHNWAHQVRDVRLYEIGSVFQPGGGGHVPHEEVRLAAVFTGRRSPGHWGEERETWDVWDLKGLLHDLAAVVGAAEPRPGSDALLVQATHFAEITDASERLEVLDGRGSLLGGGGRVLAGVLDSPAWADAAWAIEVVLRPGITARTPVYEPLPVFPGVERDLALIVPAALPAARVESVIRDASDELIEDVRPFDHYMGKGIPEDTRSIAWRLRFRRKDRTLTDEEVDAVVQRVLARLEEELDVLRR